MSRFARVAERRWQHKFVDYETLHRWSIDQPREFWTSLWEFAGVIGDPGDTVVVDGNKMPGAKFFPRGKLNFAENLLRRRDDSDAIVFRGEDRVRRRLSHRQLYDAVSRFAQALTAQGVMPGDRVCGYLPNMPETVIACLAYRRDRRGVVVVLARFRRQGRARPLRPDRAQGADPGGRLFLQRQMVRQSRQGAGDRVGAAEPRARHPWHRTAAPKFTARPASPTPSRTTISWRRSPPGTLPSRGSRSRIRFTFFIRRARPACRNASCIASARRFFSTPRSICSIATSGRATGCSISPPAAG